MTADSIIDARGLHSFYGASHVLHGVDFSVRAGEAVGLMGRNGMGKTTLIRTLIGHVEPRRGEVKINGRVMTAAFPSHAASTCSGSRSIRPAPPPSAATGTCRCGALDDLPARLAELYFRLARR